MIALLLRQEYRIRLTGRLVPLPLTACSRAAPTYRGHVDPEVVRARKRRCTRAVVAGLAEIAVGLLLSGLRVAPDLLTTAAAVVGFCLVMYGVHVGWLIFYEREPDGPPV